MYWAYWLPASADRVNHSAAWRYPWSPPRRSDTLSPAGRRPTGSRSPPPVSASGCPPSGSRTSQSSERSSLPRAYCASGKPCLCRLGEPVFRLLTVRDQQRTVPIELSHQVLSMGVTSLCQLLQLLRRAIPVLQRKAFIPDDLPQLPAGIGLSPHLLRFVMASSGQRPRR